MVNSVSMDTKWMQILENLRNTLDPGIFRVWISPLHGEVSSTSVRLSAPNALVEGWVSRKLGVELRNCSAAVLNCAPQEVKLEFGVQPCESQVAHEEKEAPAAQKQADLPYKAATVRSHRLDFSFEEFVTGPSNNLAVAAAKDICQAGQVRTLFVNAAPGLGKTHLVRAAGNALVEAKSPLRVLYITATQYASGYVSAMRDKELEKFREKLCSADVLLLEDVHFLQRKMAMQEMMLGIIKTLQAKGSRVIFTSSFAPRQFENIDPQLISYFCSGILANMDAPDLEMRKEILQRKARHFQVSLPDEVCDFLSKRVSSDVRQLEACLENIVFKARLLNSGLSVELARDTLAQFEGAPGHLELDGIVRLVCESFGVSEENLRSRSRKQEFVNGRSTVFYLARKHTSMTLEEIGCIFNRRHSTVLRSITQVEEELARQSVVGRQIARAVALIERNSGLRG